MSEKPVKTQLLASLALVIALISSLLAVYFILNQSLIAVLWAVLAGALLSWGLNNMGSG